MGGAPGVSLGGLDGGLVGGADGGPDGGPDGGLDGGIDGGELGGEDGGLLTEPDVSDDPAPLGAGDDVGAVGLESPGSVIVGVDPPTAPTGMLLPTDDPLAVELIGLDSVPPSAVVDGVMPAAESPPAVGVGVAVGWPVVSPIGV